MQEDTEMVTFADVQAKVTAALATDLQHNSQDVGQIASAIASKARAQANVMTEKYDVTESEFEAYLEAKSSTVGTAGEYPVNAGIGSRIDCSFR